MRAILLWLMIVALMTLLGVASGWVLGCVIEDTNTDMLVSVQRYMDRGWRIGLVLGTLFAACAVVGRRRAAPAAARVRSAAASLVVVVGSTVVCGGAAYALARIGWLRLPEEIGRQVGHPYRVLFCRGLEVGAGAGAALAAIWIATALWRSRRERSPLQMGEDGRPKLIELCLLDTAPPDTPGSMARYARLVERAMAGRIGNTYVHVSRRSLAPSKRLLRWCPSRARNGLHHAIVWWRAGRVRHWQADVFHVADGSHGYVALRLKLVCVVVTAHDVIPLLQSEGRFDVPAPGVLARRLIRRSIAGLRRADAIACDSACTARDVTDVGRVPEERVRFVPLPVARVVGEEMPPWLKRRDADDPFVLHVGNNAFYKNRAGVLRIFAKVRMAASVSLKMVGPAPTAALQSLVEQLGLRSHVEFVVDPSDAALGDLYAGACLLLFPSLYEGFGWPPLEAMVHGCPVVCSNAASLPEVVGDAALTAPPTEEKDLAEHCARVLTSAAVAEEYVQRGLARAVRFSEQRMTEELLDVYCAALRRWREEG